MINNRAMLILDVSHWGFKLATRSCKNFTLERGGTFWQMEEVKPKKCLSDESLMIPLGELHVDDKLRFVEEPMKVVNRKLKQLKKSRIPVIKELALLCERMFLEESDKVEKYVGGLLDIIQGSMMASKPKKMQDTIEFETELMDQKIHTLAERLRVTTRKTTKVEKQESNQAGNGNAVARAYAVGTTGANPNSNVVTGTFLLNNHYALILFDTVADRSFVSISFSSLNDTVPTTLDLGYDVE
nr:reverse transcriptase domain-containing protein [Tanacetum cinerariifolium]